MGLGDGWYELPGPQPLFTNYLAAFGIELEVRDDVGRVASDAK